jgi:hypothetical protein
MHFNPNNGGHKRKYKNQDDYFKHLTKADLHTFVRGILQMAVQTQEKIILTKGAKEALAALRKAGKEPVAATSVEGLQKYLPELKAAGAITQEGERRGAKYLVAIPPEAVAEEDAPEKVKQTRGPRKSKEGSTSKVNSEYRVPRFNATEQAENRAIAQQYLAEATAANARKHEEKRQGAGIVDAISARAKEIIKAYKDDGRVITPLEAMADAEKEIAAPFEEYLLAKYGAFICAYYGLPDFSDQTMAEARK